MLTKVIGYVTGRYSGNSADSACDQGKRDSKAKCRDQGSEGKRDHGYLLAELHSPFLEKHGSHHDAVKNTNATFGWGTKSGKEYLELDQRLRFVSERSYNEEMKKYSIRGKLFAILGRNINNRLAVFKW